MNEPTNEFPPKPAAESRGWRGVFGKVFRSPSENVVAPSQPVAETVVNIAPSIPDVVAPRLSPIMQQIEDARRERVAGKIEDLTGSTTMTPMIEAPAPEIAQAEITPPAVPAVETTPWKSAFKPEVMADIVATTQGVRITRNDSQLKEDAARTTADMARQAQATEAARHELDADLRKARPKRRIGRRDSIGRASGTQPLESPATAERPLYDAAGVVDNVFGTKPVVETPEEARARMERTHNKLFKKSELVSPQTPEAIAANILAVATEKTRAETIINDANGWGKIEAARANAEEAAQTASVNVPIEPLAKGTLDIAKPAQ